MVPNDINSENLAIPSLGECLIESPLKALLERGHGNASFHQNAPEVLFDPHICSVSAERDGKQALPALEIAGPRARIFFDPQKTHAAIVTCGGLCPGINDVIRAIVMELHYRYGVRRI